MLHHLAPAALLAILALSGCSTTTNTTANPKGSGGDAGRAEQEDAGAGGEVSEGGEGGNDGEAGKEQAGELSCTTYCRLVQENCTSDNTKQYKSDLSCVNSCAAFLLGTLEDTNQNTLGCRAQFAELAVEEPTKNCPAAGPSGGGKCGTNCDAYCALMARVCPLVYDDDASCRSACMKMDGVDETSYRSGGSGDNLQCRIYHATFGAEGFPDIHCPHASPIPTAPCAD